MNVKSLISNLLYFSKSASFVLFTVICLTICNQSLVAKSNMSALVYPPTPKSFVFAYYPPTPNSGPSK